MGEYLEGEIRKLYKHVTLSKRNILVETIMFANLKEILDNKLEDLIFDNQQITYTCDDFCITPLPDKSLLEVGISRAKYSAPIGHYVDNKDFCTHLARILPSTLTLAGGPENTKL